MTPSSSVAFFDVDGTLLPPPSMERRFIRWLFDRQIIGVPHLWRSALSLLADAPWTVARFKMNKTYLRGGLAAPFQDFGRQFVTEEILPALRKTALEAIERHRKDGDRTILLTGSIDLLALPLAQRLGLDDAICGRLERADGKFTGRTLPPHPYGRQKGVALGDYARRANIDLKQACLYCDSPSDAPALELVGRGTVVNPSPRLARLARKRGWTAVEWPDALSRRVLILA